MSSDRLKEISRELDAIAFRRRIILDTTNVGYWDWNMQTGKLWWSDHMFEVYGVNPSDFTGEVSFWYDQLDKDGYEQTKSDLEYAVKHNKTFISFFTVRDKNYLPRQVFSFGKVIKDKHDQPKRMVGVNILIPDNFEINIKK